MEKSFLNPAEITAEFINIGRKKASLTSVPNLFALGILAGAFIAFAAEGSNMAIHNIAPVGVAKALAGALFATGLMLVVVAGGELFTGNCLIVISCIEGQSTIGGLLKNWVVVYAGNFVGSVLLAYFILQSGQFNFTAGLLGGFTIKGAVYKTTLTFANAFYMGILCNWLVCLAVWLAFAANDVAGKLLGIFFPIWLFITSGFEHCVANMYYIPAGIMAKGVPAYVDSAVNNLAVTLEQIEALTWSSFIFNNLIPVTLGNIVGGAVFVGMFYWFAYLRKAKA